VEHVIEVLNYSAESLDTQILHRMAAPTCDACTSIVEYLTDIRTQGGNIQGGAWTPVESVALATPRAGVREVRVLMQFEKQRVLEGRTEKVITHPAGERFFTFFVEAADGDWLLLQIEGADS
jgi:hypothetical protein